MLKQTQRRPSAATRRTGYVFGVTFNAAVLYGIHSWPGWRQPRHSPGPGRHGCRRAVRRRPGGATGSLTLGRAAINADLVEEDTRHAVAGLQPEGAR